jgi:agmatine deiminase
MAWRLPAEWTPRESVWIGFPSHPALWLDALPGARAAVVALAAAIAADGAGERVVVVAADPDSERTARQALPSCVDTHVLAFGDIWLRDTGPLIVADSAGKLQALQYAFNGWGGKYELPGDQGIGRALAAAAGLPCRDMDWILEGGAIDVDGAGLGVTTRQCLLNPNRNPALSRARIQTALGAELGIAQLLWLRDGLAGDHTDGHVDNLARFVAPGTLAVPLPHFTDPNHSVYTDAAARATVAGLTVCHLPSPGPVWHAGELLPAAYANFYVGNKVVAVPTYDMAVDGDALAAVGALFPDRQAVGIPARTLLRGGGALHCITWSVPAG